MWIKKYDSSVKALNENIFDFGANGQNWHETEFFRGKFLEIILKFADFASEMVWINEREYSEIVFDSAMEVGACYGEAVFEWLINNGILLEQSLGEDDTYYYIVRKPKYDI